MNWWGRAVVGLLVHVEWSRVLLRRQHPEMYRECTYDSSTPLQRTSVMLLSSEHLADSTPLWIHVLQRVALSIQPEHHVYYILSQVKGFWKPKATIQWTLMNQVIKAIQNFSSFHLVSGSKAAGSVIVNELAQVAIANHLAGASTSNGEASTSGSSHNDSQEHLPGGDLTSAGPSRQRRYVTYP